MDMSIPACIARQLLTTVYHSETCSSAFATGGLLLKAMHPFMLYHAVHWHGRLEGAHTLDAA